MHNSIDPVSSTASNAPMHDIEPVSSTAHNAQHRPVHNAQQHRPVLCTAHIAQQHRPVSSTAHNAQQHRPVHNAQNMDLCRLRHTVHNNIDLYTKHNNTDLCHLRHTMHNDMDLYTMHKDIDLCRLRQLKSPGLRENRHRIKEAKVSASLRNDRYNPPTH